MLGLADSLTAFAPRWDEINSLPMIVVQGGKDRLVVAGNADYASEKLDENVSYVLLRQELGHLFHIKHTALIMQCIRALSDQQLQRCGATE